VLQLQHQLAVAHPASHSAFIDTADALERLTPYHVFYRPDPAEPQSDQQEPTAQPIKREQDDISEQATTATPSSSYTAKRKKCMLCLCPVFFLRSRYLR
jgi:hypothetical protein